MKLLGKRIKDEINFFDGKWKSIELIGEGSYGKVYKAIKSDHGITTYSAIKVIKVPQHESEIQALRREGMNNEEIKKYYQKFVDKWLDEIKLMQNLKDSINVVTIEDYEVIEDKKKINWEIVIRMELLENVEDYFKDKEITHKDILKLGLDMAKALDSCNKAKIIHRDIKPDNIFISSKGVYKLGDFGIARTLEKTTSGLSKKGTYNYMAPEVYKGDRYNHTVDIYSLGLVMYRYFNYNRTPFLPNYPEEITYEDREESILKRMSGELIPNPLNADDDETKIILKAMAFNPKDRYKNALEMIIDVEPLVKNKKYEMILPKLTSKDEKKFNKTKTNKTKEIDKFPKKETIEKTQSIFDEDIQKERIENKYNKTMSITENEQDKVKKESSKQSNENKIKKEKLLEKTQSIFDDDSKEEKNRKTIYPVGSKLEQNQHDKTISIFDEEPKKEEKIPKVKVKDISNQDKKNKKRLLIILIIILLIILLFISSFIYFKINYVEVPNLVGKDSQEAIDILDENNLIEKVETKITEDEKEVGKVLKQTKKGKIVKKETIITIIIGISEEKVEMINVVGKDVETAKKELSDLGLNVSITEEYSDTYKKGEVISQTIKENEETNKGSVVEILVSKGSKKEENNINSDNENKDNESEENNKSNDKTNNQTNDNNKNSGDDSTTSTTKTWSNWVEELPSNVTTSKYTIETKTQYSSRKKETTTSTLSTMSGWTQYDSKVETTFSTEEQTYYASTSDEMANFRTRTDIKIISTSYAVAPKAKLYACEKKSSDVSGNPEVSPVNGSCPTGYSKFTFETYVEKDSKVGDTMAFSVSGRYSYNAVIMEIYEPSMATFTYVEKTGTKTTYYFYRWTEWSSYQDAKINSNSNVEVKTRTLYRYKEK